jgi:hypothetical protein
MTEFAYENGEANIATNWNNRFGSFDVHLTVRQIMEINFGQSQAVYLILACMIDFSRRPIP